MLLIKIIRIGLMVIAIAIALGAVGDDRPLLAPHRQRAALEQVAELRVVLAEVIEQVALRLRPPGLRQPEDRHHAVRREAVPRMLDGGVRRELAGAGTARRRTRDQSRADERERCARRVVPLGHAPRFARWRGARQ